MAKKTLRLLCFGNSLTAGFPAGQPYAERLKEKLEDALLGHGYREIIYEVDGVPGDLVTRGSYLSRMEDACELSLSDPHIETWNGVLVFHVISICGYAEFHSILPSSFDNLNWLVLIWKFGSRETSKT